MRKLLKRYMGYSSIPIGESYVIPNSSAMTLTGIERFFDKDESAGTAYPLNDERVVVYVRGKHDCSNQNYALWTIDGSNDKRIKLTKALLEEKRKELEFCDFLICDNAEKQWRMKDGGTISNPDKASYYRMADMEKIVEEEGKGKDGVTVYYIEGSDWSKPRCKIEEAISSTVIELLQLAPTNPISRSLAMSQIKQSLPEEADTWDKIKTWIEFNIRPSIIIRPDAPSANRTEVLRVPCIVRYVESGTRRYTQRVTETCEFSLTSTQLATFINGRRNIPMGEVIAHIKLLANDDSTNELGSGDCDYGDTDDGETIESTNENIRPSVESSDDEIRVALEAWLNNNPTYRASINMA